MVHHLYFILFIYIISGKRVKGDYAMFEHTGTKIFIDFDLVRKEIEDETDRITGNNKICCVFIL